MHERGHDTDKLSKYVLLLSVEDDEVSLDSL